MTNSTWHRPRFAGHLLRAALALVAVSVWTVAGSSQETAQREVVPASEVQINLTFAPLVRIAAPTVVNVYATRAAQNGERARQGLGSGVIVDPFGLIITNNHVIDGAADIRVALADGVELAAQVIIADARLDLAAIRIPLDHGPYPALAIGDSDALQIGDLVLAIGDPFGVGQTVTSGIVSGLTREIPNSAAGGPVFVQTDAAINPGNSGGALINISGQLIGINTAIVSRSGGNEGIGFAVPSNLVAVFLDAARREERVRFPWTGAYYQDVTQPDADDAGVAALRGATIIDVFEDSPAASAGLQVGDIVLAIDGMTIDQASDLIYRTVLAGLGHVAVYDVVRRGEMLRISVEAVAAPETVPPEQARITGPSPLSGATIANLSPALAEEIGYPGVARGVIIRSVSAGSSAEQSGFQADDVIVSVNGATLTSTSQLQHLVIAAPANWQIQILRAGRTMSRTFAR